MKYKNSKTAIVGTRALCLAFVLLCCTLIAAPSSLLASQMRSPTEFSEITRGQIQAVATALRATDAPSNSAMGQAARFWVRFFSGYISPADGPRSPSYPTGSAYGLEAIRTHGFFWGITLTADRLLHEIEPPGHSTIYIFGQERYFDPLIANTHWWYSRHKAAERQ